jgi:hypothetical protein
MTGFRHHTRTVAVKGRPPRRRGPKPLAVILPVVSTRIIARAERAQHETPTEADR